MIKANKELIPLADDEGNTALHLACIEGYVNVAKVLIDKGTAVDARCVLNNVFCVFLHMHGYIYIYSVNGNGQQRVVI